ncbi:MAG: hypothetical protein AABX82_03075, partial [Nanoarchaeota archaeon]
MTNTKKGAFGEVTRNFDAGTATKETYRFRIITGEETKAGSESPTERFYRERVMDATAVSYPFIIETYSVEKRTDQESKEGYDSGLRIVMPLCKLFYQESSQNDNEERAATIEELARRYMPDVSSIQSEDPRTNPAYIAWVFETVMNVGEALAYLHSKGRYHKDLHLQNILVDTLQPLGKDVTELADKVRVYVADMLGEDREYFFNARERKEGGTYSERESDIERRSRMIGERAFVDMNSIDKGDKEEVAKAYARGDIEMLGAMAAWMLVGIEKNSMEDTIYKNPRNGDVNYYCSMNSSLGNMKDIITTIRKTGTLKVVPRLKGDEYIPYNSMREFLDRLKGELEKYFYTTKRENLPRDVQEKVGTTEGWIVRTPTMFYSLMYAGRKDIPRNEEKTIERDTLIIQQLGKEIWGST